MLLLLIPEQSIDHGDSIQTLGEWGSGQFGGGREKIPECPNLIAHLTRLDFFWPARQSRDTNAAFVEIALDSTQQTAGLKKLRIVAAFPVGPVVARENHQGIVIE